MKTTIVIEPGGEPGSVEIQGAIGKTASIIHELLWSLGYEIVDQGVIVKLEIT